ncbi:alpha/beta hydrolase [Cyanobacteria bacterium FACHB-471]|nr:alpha/beta hydrolase [Cyanobacteria bacterium FACHB-471]
MKKWIYWIIALFTLVITFATAAVVVEAQQPQTVDMSRSIAANEENFNARFTHHMTEVNGIRLHYVTGGQENRNETVVLLHGYPQTWYGWRKVMPTLAERYTVIVPDMRGLGESSRPDDSDYTKKVVADDIYKLLQSLEVDRIYVTGQDMGAPVTYSLAAQHPDMVAAVALIDSGIPGFRLEAAMDSADGGTWHFGFFAAPKFPEMLTEGREKEFLTKFAFRSPYVYRQETVTDADIDKYLRSYITPGDMSAGFGYYRAFAQDAKDNAINETLLSMPFLAIAGEKGTGNFTLTNIAQAASNVRGVILQNCGHFVYDECPSELSQQLLSFFDAERFDVR